MAQADEFQKLLQAYGQCMSDEAAIKAAVEGILVSFSDYEMSGDTVIFSDGSVTKVNAFYTGTSYRFKNP